MIIPAFDFNVHFFRLNESVIVDMNPFFGLAIFILRIETKNIAQ